MGRKKAPLAPAEYVDKLEIFETYMLEYANGQDDGLAYFGESVYKPEERTAKANAFYALQVDPPDPAGDNLMWPCAGCLLKRILRSGYVPFSRLTLQVQDV